MVLKLHSTLVIGNLAREKPEAAVLQVSCRTKRSDEGVYRRVHRETGIVAENHVDKPIIKPKRSGDCKIILQVYCSGLPDYVTRVYAFVVEEIEYSRSSPRYI